jgi:hypothetical protein
MEEQRMVKSKLLWETILEVVGCESHRSEPASGIDGILRLAGILLTENQCFGQNISTILAEHVIAFFL